MCLNLMNFKWFVSESNVVGKVFYGLIWDLWGF